MKKWAMGFMRSTVVFLTFFMDVKVQADIIFQAVTGPVEIQKDGDLVSLPPPSKILEPLDVQTLSGGVAKFAVNSVYVGVAPKSYVNCAEQPECRLYWGKFLVKAPLKDTGWFMLKTPHADLRFRGGECLVKVDKSRSTVSVVKGELEVRDRSSDFSQVLRSGYALWVGGLKSTGGRAHGDIQAAPLDEVMNGLKFLGTYTEAELKNRYDQFRPIWREAVDTVALETQDQVNGDMKILAEIRAGEAKKVARDNAENGYLRKLFRARARGELDTREPASATPSDLSDYIDPTE